VPLRQVLHIAPWLNCSYSPEACSLLLWLCRSHPKERSSAASVLVTNSSRCVQTASVVRYSFQLFVRHTQHLALDIICDLSKHFLACPCNMFLTKVPGSIAGCKSEVALMGDRGVERLCPRRGRRRRGSVTCKGHGGVRFRRFSNE